MRYAVKHTNIAFSYSGHTTCKYDLNLSTFVTMHSKGLKIGYYFSLYSDPVKKSSYSESLNHTSLNYLAHFNFFSSDLSWLHNTLKLGFSGN